MTDTDKYEGHTPAPWEFTDFDPLHLWGESPIISGGEGYSQNEADWKLIADAPLLLAEVKRLRMIVARLEDARIEDVGIHERPKLFAAVHEIYAQRLQDIYHERREEE